MNGSAELTPLLEPPHVSTKWRTLTRQYGRFSGIMQEDKEQQVIITIQEELSQVVLAVGHGANHTAALSTVREKTHSSIRDVVRLAIELNAVLGHQLGSREMSVICPKHNEKMDPSSMLDGYSGGEWEQSQQARSGRVPRVLCTTDLGLVRLENEEKIKLIPAKVALNTLFDRRQTWR